MTHGARSQQAEATPAPSGSSDSVRSPRSGTLYTLGDEKRKMGFSSQVWTRVSGLYVSLQC